MNDVSAIVTVWDLFFGFVGSFGTLVIYGLVRQILLPSLRRRGVLGRSFSHKWEWALDFVFLLIISLHLILVLGGVLSGGGVMVVGLILLSLAYLVVPLVRDSVWGLYFFWNGDIEIGDMVSVGSITGYVRAIGLLGARVEDLEANIHMIPVGHFRRLGLKKVIQSEALEMVVLLPKVKMDLEELHTRLLFAPYIAPGSEVEVNRRDNEVEVKLHLIHSTFKEPVRRYIDRLL